MRMQYHRTNITNESFSMPVVRKILDRLINKITHELYLTPPLIVDPFARESFLTNGNYNTITNDLNPEFKTDYNLEAKDFAAEIKERGVEIDLVVFDPPYSLRMLKDHYDGIGAKLELWQTHNMWGECKDDLASCMKVGSYAVSFGWHTHGFGGSRGFKKTEVHVIEQVASQDRYNLLVTVEKKTQTDLFKFK